MKHNRWLAVLAVAAGAAVAQKVYTDYSSKLAPYVPSPQPVVERMLDLAQVKQGDTVFDLGCGDGRVIITAAKRYKAKAVGFEISEKLVRQANEQISHLGMSDRAKAVQADVRTVDLSGADVVVMYLLTESNAQLRPRLEKMLKPGARVVSYEYAVPGWKPARVDKSDDRHGHAIYVYEMPPVPVAR